MREALVAAGKALDGCRSSTAWALLNDELLSCVDEVHALVQQVAAVQLALVRQVDSRGLAVAEGASSTLAWLRDRHRISGREASRQVKLARALDAGASATADALAAGEVNVEQAQVIADAVATLPTEHRAAGEEHLLGEAEVFGPKELGRLGQRIFEVVAPDEAEQRALAELERAERRAWHNRGLWLTDIAGTSQVRVTGWLDQEDATTVRATLGPLCAPRTMRRPSRRGSAAGAGSNAGASADADLSSGAGSAGGDNGVNDADPTDVRSPGERCADALVEVCRLASACGKLPDNGGDRPQVVVTIDYDKLRQQVGAATLDDGNHLSPAAARRIACDAGIIPTILGSASQILDQGRQTRLVTGPLRRALVVRDKGCAFPHLRPATPLVSRSSHHPLGQQRPHRPEQPGLTLRLPPPSDPPLRVASKDQPRRRIARVHPTRIHRP